MIKKVALLSLVAAGSLLATDLRFDLGAQSRDSKVKSTQIVLNQTGESTGFTSKYSLGYFKHDTGKAYGISALFGWQFGDKKEWVL